VFPMMSIPEDMSERQRIDEHPTNPKALHYLRRSGRCILYGTSLIEGTGYACDSLGTGSNEKAALEIDAVVLVARQDFDHCLSVSNAAI
jgi:hypothetical protein